MPNHVDWETVPAERGLVREWAVTSSQESRAKFVLISPYVCYCEGKLVGKLCLIDVLLRVVLMQSEQTLIKLKLWIRPEFRHFQRDVNHYLLNYLKIL